MVDDRTALLWLAIEDYAGLWEALWELRPLHPEADDRELRRRSQRELAELVDQGMVALYHCQEPDDAMWPAGEDEISSLLDADGNWVVPEGRVISVRFNATVAGEQSQGIRRERTR